MLTTEQVTQTLEQAMARYEELNAELANVDDKIRERDSLRNQIDWLQDFPGLAGVDFNKVADRQASAPASPGEVIQRAAEQQAEVIVPPQAVESLAKMKIPELKALARQENIEVSGNKQDIVDSIATALYGEPEEPEEPEDEEPTAIPEGFAASQEAAPAPQAVPEPEPAPQAKASPFTF